MSSVSNDKQIAESMPILSVYDEGSANTVDNNCVYYSFHLFYNPFLKSTGLNKWNYSLSATICFFLDRQPDDERFDRYVQSHRSIDDQAVAASTVHRAGHD